GLQRFYGKKTEHENEIQKRRHQERVRAEEAPPAPLLAQTRRITQRALLKQAPYNSCCARNRSGASGGRASSSGSCPSSDTSVSLTQSGHPGHPRSESSALHTTSEQSLPGHSGSSPDVGEQKCSKGKERVRRKKGEDLSGRAENSTTDPDTERALKHYLRLKSSGWIPDGSGKWVKDQNVEFDSDEEEPPTLPSS
ncbi:hypothetical protein FKM82_021067, partial [Ascaphus truei]